MYFLFGRSLLFSQSFDINIRTKFDFGTRLLKPFSLPTYHKFKGLTAVFGQPFVSLVLFFEF